MNRILTATLALLAAAAAEPQVLTEIPRAANGRPDLSGVWQALNNAHWNLEPTPGGFPVLLELGAQFAVPSGPGVVDGGTIPYLPEARAERDRRFESRLADDPEGKCYMGGVPRSTYMPYPFQILQSERDVVIYYQFATAFRRIFVDGKEEAPLDSWMGWSNGRWDGNTFVVEVTGLNGLTWLDRAGNYASSNARITERYTPLGPNHLQYEATIDDATVFSRPWTIRMPLYRVVDQGFRILEFKCETYAEEKIYGHLRKPGTEHPAGASSPMKHTHTLILAGLAAAIAPLCAQAQKPPRTAWGDPDLRGAYSEFTTAPLERAPEYGEKEFLAREEYEEFAKRRLETRFDADDTEPGTQEDVHYSMGQFQLSENEGVHSLNLRTSIVTQPKNGRIPPLTAAATARRDARAAARRGKEFDGPEMRSLTERCIIWSSTQPPILPRGYNSNLQIFQSPGYVIVQGEMGDPRVIPTDGRKLPDKLLPQWNGTSVGRWDGETFVIETAGFHPDSAWRNASENMRVTERIKRIDEDTLEYAFTVVDPDTWAEPWGGVYPLTKLDGLLYEYACTEGNYGMANILSGARVAEKEAAAKQ